MKQVLSKQERNEMENEKNTRQDKKNNTLQRIKTDTTQQASERNAQPHNNTKIQRLMTGYSSNPPTNRGWHTRQTQSQVLNLLWTLKKNGYSDYTIKNYGKSLDTLAKH